jgi:hypothetical protein
MLGQPAHLRHYRRVQRPPAQAFDQASLAGIFSEDPKHNRIASWLITLTAVYYSDRLPAVPRPDR